jgi:type II secretory pathway pseudopilin PulG
MNNNKGITLVELLIVIVVMSFIVGIAAITISEVLLNFRKNALVSQAKVFEEAARLSYAADSDIWDDNIATLNELITEGSLESLNEDPWGGTYDLEESYVALGEAIVGSTKERVEVFQLNATPGGSYTLHVRIVTTKATLGYDVALETYDKEDVVLINSSDGSLAERIVQLFDNDIDENIDAGNENDEITVNDDIQDSVTINTTGGNDTVTIGDDIKGNSSVNLGSGDDVLNMNGEVTDDSSIDSGEGNDIINIGDDIQKDSTVNTGEGNDLVTVGDDLQSGAVLNTGSGDDQVTVGDDLEDGTINTGSGNDSITIDKIRDESYIDAGEDDDTLLINDISSSFDGRVTMGSGDDTVTLYDERSSRDFARTRGTFDGGSGYDILNLPGVTESQWNDYVSDLFTNFEEVNLHDTTINT